MKFTLDEDTKEKSIDLIANKDIKKNEDEEDNMDESSSPLRGETLSDAESSED